MLTLSGVPDRVVSWSEFSLQHKKVRKLNRICHTFFQAFTGFVILTTYWSSVDASPLWLLSYKLQSLTCVTCFGLMLNIGLSFLLIQEARGAL